MSSVFGEPNKGVHAYRVFGLAAVDVGLTVVLAVLVAWGWCWARPAGGWTGVLVATLAALVALFALGALAHWVFRVDTTLNVAMFGRWQTGNA